MDENSRSDWAWSHSLCFGLLFFGSFVLWTELHPSGIACGSVSTACASCLKNIRVGVEMHRGDHGVPPRDLLSLTPKYLSSLPECSGSFNGCRVRTVFGLRSFLANLNREKVGDPEVPQYSRFKDGKGRFQYTIICKRKHELRYSYDSRSDEFTHTSPGTQKISTSRDP